MESARRAGVATDKLQILLSLSLRSANRFDSGSPQLALLAAGGGGGTINSGAIDLVQLASGQARYLRINLTNILISSYSQSSGGGVPSESVSLAPH